MIHQLNRYLCDPATGALLVGAQSGDAVDVDRAVYAAYDALPGRRRACFAASDEPVNSGKCLAVRSGRRIDGS
jgi:hypothetical protein